jgi:predicted PurR-regulated permease PerM
MEVVRQPGEDGGREPDALVIRMPVDVRSVTLTVIAVLGSILMLQYAEPVLVPVVVGILLSYVLAPPVTSLERRGVPRLVGAILVLGLFCAAIGAGIYSLTGQAMEIVESVPVAAQKIVERSRTRPAEEAGALEKVQEAARQVEEAAEEATTSTRTTRPGVQRVEVVEPTLAASQYLWEGGRGLIALAAQFTMVLFLVFFMLVTGDLFKRKLVKIAGPTLTKKKISVQIMDDDQPPDQQLPARAGHHERHRRRWRPRSRCGRSASSSSIVWGLLAGLFNTIPYLGPLIVSGGLAVVAFMQFDERDDGSYVCGAAMAITGSKDGCCAPRS